jgi:hypothetical protein
LGAGFAMAAACTAESEASAVRTNAGRMVAVVGGSERVNLLEKGVCDLRGVRGLGVRV